MIMFPSYSPLFTMGLLAEHASPSPPSPTEPASASLNFDGASAIYFTLQTGKRDTLELRSFLYLDLADHKHRLPSSHRRKYSTLSRSTSWTCTADAKSTHDFARTEKPMITTSPTPVVSTRRRTSKESLRSIPSPKPAPSTTLPDIPAPVSLSPPSSTPLSSSSSSKKRPASTVVSSLLAPNRRNRPTSSRSASISSYDRRKGRMDALARLEGRSRATSRVPRSSSLRNNFMSFSDDEDEKPTTPKSSTAKAPTIAAVHGEDINAFADVEDEADAIIPNPSRKREAADMATPAQPARPARKRRSTIDSWFPLKSFIDLKDDDLSSWNWRSFIEIGGVA